VEEVFFPRDLLRRSPDVHDIFEIFRRFARLAHHLIGNIEANDLAEAFWSVAYETRQKACGPARAAAQVQHALAGTKVHQAERLFGDVEMVILHLRSFTGRGPAVEFLLQLFVGSRGLVRHNYFPRKLWS